MAKVMEVIDAIHPTSHALFIAILQMTWSENKQWIPDFLASSIESELGVSSPVDIPDWMEPAKELIEYFDFVQKVFGGAIADIWKQGKQMYMDVVKAAGGFMDSAVNAKLEADVSVTFPKPPLTVPLMSISK